MRRALAVGGALVMTLSALAQNDGTARKDEAAELLAEVRGIAARVAEMRGAGLRRPPLAVRAPRDMHRAAAEVRAYNVLARERLEARGRAWADLGLGDSATPARLFLALAQDLDGLGYDLGNNRLFIDPGVLTDRDFVSVDQVDAPANLLMLTGVRWDEPRIAHLLVHARQRESSGGDLLRATTDALLADAAWSEGEANLLAIRYLFEGMGLADEILGMDIRLQEILGGGLVAPSLLELDSLEGDLARFVYLDGFDRAVEVFKSGGWPELDAAARKRRSTRDLLHLERAPTAAVFLGDGEAPFAGSAVADRDRLGEQAIVALVSRSTGKENLGMLAGDGWLDDRVVRWERPGATASGVTLWDSRWESSDAAGEFEYAYLRALGTRLAKPDIARAEDGSYQVDGDGRRFTVRRRDSEVRVRIGPRAVKD